MNTTLNQLKPKRIHALRAGTWAGMSGPTTLTVADLVHIAESYDPAKHEAPAVIGHPATDAPAWGWVRSADVQPDGLWLDVDLQPELAELVEQRRYAKVSVSLYPPAHPANPTPGVYALKHLGFLGAQPPAVKGLQALQLSEDSQIITFEFSEEKEPMMAEKEELAAVAQRESAVQLAEQQLEDERKQLQRDKELLEERNKALRKTELENRLAEHIQAARILPKDKALVLSFCEALDHQTTDLAEGEQSQLEKFFGFLAGLPAQVELSEVAGQDKTLPAVGVVNFSAPQGYEADPQDMALHKKVIHWLQANPGKGYPEGLQAVQKGL